MFQNNFSLYDDKVVIFYNTDSESSTVIKAQDTKNLLQELENHKDNALLVDKVASNKVDSNTNVGNLQTLSNRITTTKRGNVHKDSSILSQSLKTQGNLENIMPTTKKLQKENLFETKFKQVAVGGENRI